jgi:hypothetical protein
MVEVRTADTLRPGRRAAVRLTLTTGEVVRLVLGADTARHLLEVLLRHPHLRNVAADLLEGRVPGFGVLRAGGPSLLARPGPVSLEAARAVLAESRQLLARMRGRRPARERMRRGAPQG